MNLAIQIKRGVSAEIYKYKKTFTFWLLILAPAFIPIISFLVLFFKGTEIIKEDQNAWEFLVSFSTNPGNFLFPFFIIMLALLVNNIEYNANTWKLIYAQPLSRVAVYFAKVKVFTIMLFTSLMLFSTFTLLVGFILRFVSPELGFDQPFNFGFAYSLNFKVFLATLGMASIQFWISQHWKNLILPLGVGIGGVISFLILAQGWEYATYHPYGYHILAIGGAGGEGFNLWDNMDHVYYSLGLAVVVFILAGIEQAKKRII